jgi:hypothetical protein
MVITHLVTITQNFQNNQIKIRLCNLFNLLFHFLSTITTQMIQRATNPYARAPNYSKTSFFIKQTVNHNLAPRLFRSLNQVIVISHINLIHNNLILL